MTLASSRLATMLGRGDQAAAPIDPYSGTSGGFQANAGISGGLLGSNVDANGRITAGLLGLLLVAVAGFYIWTRDLQA